MEDGPFTIRNEELGMRNESPLRLPQGGGRAMRGVSMEDGRWMMEDESVNSQLSTVNPKL
ncbi:MAG: hypothetical protein K6A93_09285 [Bacteroidaceae bacterium]|nr:hypothetical protein [Bacteroidaceae bacterium]